MGKFYQKKKYIQIFITKNILKKVAHVIILSDQMEEIVSRYTQSYSIIPCGVDTSIFKIIPNKNFYKKEEYLLIFPSEPKRQIKNFPLFKAIVDILINDYDLILLYECIQNLNRYQIADLMNKANCLLMTSFAEGSPQVVKEALACGLPVVSTNVGDVENLLANIPNCFVSDLFDAKQMAKLVYDCLLTQSERINIRTSFLIKNLDLNSIAQKIFFIYEKTHEKYYMDRPR